MREHVTSSGRARRPECWWSTPVLFLVSLMAELVDRAAGTEVLATVVALATLLPSLAVSVRRLQDTSRSGWLLLLLLAIPVVGWILLVVYAAQDSTRSSDRHGPSPEEQVATVG